MSAGRPSLAGIVLLSFGVLWIFLAGACCGALGPMSGRGDPLRALAAVCTLPGFIIAFGGANLLFSARTTGIGLIVYAAGLTAVLLAPLAGGFGSSGSPSQGVLVMGGLACLPGLFCLLWGVSLLRAKREPPA